MPKSRQCPIDSLDVGCLGCKDGRKLALATRPLEKHHKVARHGQCHVAAEILFHERQSEVDPSRHARGGPYRAVTHEDRVGLDAHGGKLPNELGTV